MPLAFETLRDRTVQPPPSRDEVLSKRLQTVARLVDLGLSHDLIGSACDVRDETVRQWQRGRSRPRNIKSRIALDRICPVLNHMKSELALDDESIYNFFTRESVQGKSRRLGPESRWQPAYRNYISS